MAQIDSFDIDSPVQLGKKANTTIASSPTAGGALSATLNLSAGNDVYFAASPPSKSLVVAATGVTPFQLERGQGKTSPLTVRVTLKVAETGLSIPASRFRLVDIR